MSHWKKNIFTVEMALYWLEVILVFTLFKYPILLAGLLAFSGFICFRYLYSTEDKIMYVCAFFMGPIAELASIALGAWVYTYQGPFVLPVWVPFAWGFVVVMISRVARSLAALLREKNIIKS